MKNSIIKNEIRKTFGYRFWICLLIGCALAINNSVIIEYSKISIYIGGNITEMSFDIVPRMMIHMSILLATIPCGMSYIKDLESDIDYYIKNNIKRKYLVTRLICSNAAAGIMISLPISIYNIIIYIRGYEVNNGMIIVLYAFLFGAMCNMICFAVSVFLKEKALVMLIPYILFQTIHAMYIYTGSQIIKSIDLITGLYSCYYSGDTIAYMCEIILITLICIVICFAGSKNTVSEEEE